MERLLYQKIYEKISSKKSSKTLGGLASFLITDIPHGIGTISEKTIKRGFQKFLNSEILEKYNNTNKIESENQYIPDVNTLNILSVYLDYKSFSDFCSSNKDHSLKIEKSKNNVSVYQSSNGTSFGNLNAQGDINIFPKNDV